MKFKEMTKEEKKDWIETIIGGIFGVAAIIATIFEYKLGDGGAVAGMLKDVFGTAVVVVLLIASVPPRKPVGLEKILEKRVEKWGIDNSPMIFKVEGYVCAKEQKYKQGFALLQNPLKYVALLGIEKDTPEWHTYAGYTSKQTGKFLDLPSYKEMVSGKFDVMFVLEQKHFKEKEEITTIIEDIINATQSRFGEENIEVKRIGTSEKFTIKFLSAIKNKNDIDFFISVVDFVLSLVKVIA